TCLLARDPAPAKPLDSFTVERLRSRAALEQRARSRQHAEPPIASGAARPLLELAERVGRLGPGTDPDGRLHQLDEGPSDEAEGVALAPLPGRFERRAVPAQPVVEHGGRVAGDREHGALASSPGA